MQKWNAAFKAVPGVACVRTITPGRRRKWNACVKKPGYLAAWVEALQKLPVHNTASFQWQPTFDWMLSIEHVTKLLEGNYDQADQGAARNARVEDFINE